LVAYFVSMTGAFGALGAVSRNRQDADSLRAFRGLAWHRPGLAALMSGAVFSLAGIPLTAGFFAKFQVLAAGIHADLWLLVMILVVNSAIGLYYYLRIIVAIYEPPPTVADEGSPAAAIPPAIPPLSLASGAALSALSFILVWLGVYPGPLLHLLQAIAIGVG
jgi:NADH-quinone oxidoreductase subunit N